MSSIPRSSAVRTLSAAGALALAGTLSACATVDSRPVSLAAKPSEDSAGLTYFLPRKQVKVTATRAPLDIDKLKTARDASAKAADDADAALRSATTKRKEADLKLGGIKPRAAGWAAQRIVVESAVADEVAARSKAVAADGELAYADGQLQAARSGKACAYDAKLELLAAEPDPDFRFVAHLPHNWARDDTTTLKASAQGLLNSADIVAADHTSDIIVDVAGIIGLAGGAALPVVKPNAEFKEFLPPPPPKKPPATCEPLRIVKVFDPMSANVPVAVGEFPFQVSVEKVAGDNPANRNNLEVAARLRGRGDGAIYYRSPAPMKIILQRTDSGAGLAAMLSDLGEQSATTPTPSDIDAAIALVPQAGPIGFVPTNSSLFVKTADKIEFTDGVLTSWNPDRPSELVELFSLPIKVATALVSVPAQLVSAKVDYSTKDKSLIDAQKAQIESQTALQKLKACLAAAKVAGTPPDACMTAK